MSNGEVRVLLGNEAIARGLVESGCQFFAAYPGTPSSEILPSLVRFKKENNLNIYIEWSTNEKVAFENGLVASYTGKRTAIAMKQVGLNVATDPLMSAAYIGTVGGFVIISCDDFYLIRESSPELNGVKLVFPSKRGCSYKGEDQRVDLRNRKRVSWNPTGKPVDPNRHTR